MALAAQLSQTESSFHASAPPDISSIVTSALDTVKTAYDPSSAIKVGDKFPDFALPDAHGQQTTSSSLLSKGPLLISFYRGSWCPYCNVELRALQQHIIEFKNKGVTLVAISPELPDTSLTTQETHELGFPVLSDVDNKLAHQLGIVCMAPETMRTVQQRFGLDMEKRIGRDSMEVPVPATFLVDGKGVVRNKFVDADWTKRLEPETAMEWIDAL